MDPKSTYIIEALKMQPLSEEEKASRHILGRLYGPIATCTEKTRNGRGYNRALWEKALADDIFKEKIGYKSLFLELGHPADREETDMRCVCACIPEMPKIIDGDLYAYVDILDTDNGRLLKTLCDYGFVPGISSRGSGDVMDNDEVDPETFFLETWDIVQLPAVKKARLAVCESLNKDNVKLNKALRESYDKADNTGKAAIKQACENLGLEVSGIDEKEEVTEDMSDTELDANIKKFTDEFKKNNGGKEPSIRDYAASLKTESCKTEACDVDEGKHTCYKGGTPKDIKDIPFAPEDRALTEADEDAEVLETEVVETEETPVESTEDVPDDFEGQIDFLVADEQEAIDGYEKVLNKIEDEHVANELEKIETEEKAHKEFLDTVKDNPEAEYVEPLETEDEVEETEIEVEEALTEEAEEEEAEANTVGDMIKQFQGYDENLVVEFDTIKIDDKEYQVAEMSLDDSEEGKILIGLTCEDISGNADNDIDVEGTEDEVENTEEPAEDVAEDDGADEVVESVKDLIRQKSELEDMTKTLKQAKAVGDAMVKELKEELERYKAAFARTSSIAAKTPELERTVEALNATIQNQATQIKTLNENLNSVKTTANAASATKVQSLTEALNTVKADAQAEQQKLQEALTEQHKRTQEQTKLAQAYKNKCSALIERYIASKAEMLGVRTSDIKCRLKENYSLADIDAACEVIMSDGRPSFSLGGGKTKIKVNESIEAKQRGIQDPSAGYEIDDSLLELAGLK